MSETAPAPRRSRLKTALLVSLAFNLFLVGLIGGQLFFGAGEETRQPAGARGYSLHPRVIREALPEERHDDIQAFTNEVRKGMRGRWQGMFAIRGDMDAALRARPFDLEALRKAQQSEIEKRGEIRATYNEQVAAFIATLTDAEREKIADTAMERMEAQIAYLRERRSRREAREQAESQ